MKLPSDLLSQFAKVTNDKKEKTERTFYGTIVEKDGKVYVQLDGSGVLTPAQTTVKMLSGERVMVMIKNHTAIVTGNLTSPAATSEDVKLSNAALEAAAKTATNFVRKDENGIVFGDHESDTDTDVQLQGKSFHYYVKSAQAVFKPYYEFGDSLDVEWFGSGYVSDGSTNVYFSIPISKPVIGNPSVTVSSANGLKIRQNGMYTHGSSSSTYVTPTYSATLSCDGGIINVIATLSSTTNAMDESPCGITASIKIAFSQ